MDHGYICKWYPKRICSPSVFLHRASLRFGWMLCRFLSVQRAARLVGASSVRTLAQYIQNNMSNWLLLSVMMLNMSSSSTFLTSAFWQRFRV